MSIEDLTELGRWNREFLLKRGNPAPPKPSKKRSNVRPYADGKIKVMAALKKLNLIVDVEK
jgi:hypothetical protein